VFDEKQTFCLLKTMHYIKSNTDSKTVRQNMCEIIRNVTQ